ncbi:MAG TPA: hypothetical protein VNT60_05985 [Deinococcales bacterium]|nr:hypothetical protein [Deinococcales bacterium]
MKKSLFVSALAATILPLALAQTAAPAAPANPAAQPAQAAPAQQATPVDQLVQAAPVSYLTSITFPTPAQRPAGAEGNRSVSQSVSGLTGVVKELLGKTRYCGTGEVVFWSIADQSAGVELVGAVNARLRAFGYQLELKESGNYGVTAVVVFTASSQRQNVFGVWGLQPGSLSLAWCRLEGR